MALSQQQRTNKIRRMIDQHEALLRTVMTHQVRLAAALKTLMTLDDDLEMHAQHRLISDEVREEVARALAATEAARHSRIDGGPEDIAEDTASEDDTSTVPDDASELVEQV